MEMTGCFLINDDTGYISEVIVSHTVPQGCSSIISVVEIEPSLEKDAMEVGGVIAEGFHAVCSIFVSLRYDIAAITEVEDLVMVVVEVWLSEAWSLLVGCHGEMSTANDVVSSDKAEG